jgi:malate synthase
MNSRIESAGLSIAGALFKLVNEEIVPGTGIDASDFWQGMADIFTDLGPKNRALLEKRDRIQQQLDEWHRDHPGNPDMPSYKQLLSEIGYLLPEGPDFDITTANVDPEIAEIAGPQLVVPVSNARFALNAANARWGSLYDAFYGTDVIPEDDGCEKGARFNPLRGEKVIEKAAEFLDEVFPLASGNHLAVQDYRIDESASPAHFVVSLENGTTTGLARKDQFAGYVQKDNELLILLKNNGLHAELQINPDHPIGRMSACGMKDVVLEAAITTIQDCEDSVAAVDAEDKVGLYRNWLGLIKGDLTATFDKGGKKLVRKLNPDRTYSAPDGERFTLPGRSLLLVRNSGHLMTCNAVLDSTGREVPEGILDAMVTSLCSIYDLRHNSVLRNSRSGSIYIVKPKMHGPEEVAFTSELFLI